MSRKLLCCDGRCACMLRRRADFVYIFVSQPFPTRPSAETSLTHSTANLLKRNNGDPVQNQDGTGMRFLVPLSRQFEPTAKVVSCPIRAAFFGDQSQPLCNQLATGVEDSKTELKGKVSCALNSIEVQCPRCDLRRCTF